MLSCVEHEKSYITSGPGALRGLGSRAFGISWIPRYPNACFLTGLCGCTWWAGHLLTVSGLVPNKRDYIQSNVFGTSQMCSKLR